MESSINLPLVLYIFLTMALSAFFSGMEIAFVSSNRMLAEMDKERNASTQRFLTFFYKHPNGFVSTMLVGNNIVLVIYGILIARLFDNTIFSGMDPAFTVPAEDTIQEQSQQTSCIVCPFGLSVLRCPVANKQVLNTHI